jgi:lipopolysaccharide/colanic/teichoic acid biosynthesis glycosyltransferase
MPEEGAADDTRDRSRYERWVKPAIDQVGAVVLLFITLPVMVAVALAVWIDLGSPVLLRQERVGRSGYRFKVLKFRSMEPDRRADRLSYVGPERRLTHKSETDPRLTPVGRFIRKWSLDELPQLVNVLLGDMSLVGPRPELVSIVARYQPWQHRRHDVKPGLTGLWQISARGAQPMHEATGIDLEYVDSVSLRTDLRILLGTFPAAFGRRTGY